MLYLPCPDDGHRLDTAVRMIGKARLIVGGIGRLEMVEEQERVEVVQTSSPDTPAKMDARSLDDGLRRHHSRDRPRDLAHACLLRVARYFLLVRKSSRRFCDQQASLRSVQTGRSLP